MIKGTFFLLLISFGHIAICAAQPADIPGSYSNLSYDGDEKLYFEKDGFRYYKDESGPVFTLKQLLGGATGTDTGISMDFGNFEGTITYGLIPYDQAPHPLPVFRFTKPLKNGKVAINITRDFDYPYDFVGWLDKGHLTLGYRLADQNGQIIFDGELSVTGTGPFEAVPTLYEGPFVGNIDANGAVIWFKTSEPVEASVEIDGRTFCSEERQRHHEFTISGLKPSQKYDYTVTYGALQQTYHFKTAPAKGSRQPFVFAYTSDSRHATGGGEPRSFPMADTAATICGLVAIINIART